MAQEPELERLEAVSRIINKVKEAYHDAKKLEVDIYFEFVEASTDQEDELCPRVIVSIER